MGMSRCEQKLSGVLASVSLLLQISGVTSWPEGTFGLPMPKTGCPVGKINEWETGTRTHVTEKGSHASENVHLAGVDSAPAEHIVQLFCMKMYYPQEDDYRWMPGKYCIFKKGDCPKSFHEGYVMWDDAAASWFSRNDARQNYKGVLPDGEYYYNTKIFYCCRMDGSTSHPIQLPSSAPFYLLKFGDYCQEVEGMSVTEEWVYWSDEKTANLNYQGGVHPKVVRSRHPRVYTKLFYCYYQPKPPNLTANIIMMMIYVAGGIIGTTIIACVIVCIIKRLCQRKRKCPNNAPSPETHSPYASTSPPSNPPHVYRYTTLQTNEDAGRSVAPSAPPLTSTDEPPRELTVILRDQDFRPASLPPSYEEVIKQMAVTS